VTDLQSVTTATVRAAAANEAGFLSPNISPENSHATGLIPIMVLLPDPIKQI
jgi:hypothetical protein